MAKIITIFMLITLVIGGLYFYGVYSSDETSQQQESHPLSEKNLVIDGDKIIDPETNRVLFVNVVNVAEARYGKDGKTIHFKRFNKELSANYDCVDITRLPKNYQVQEPLVEPLIPQLSPDRPFDLQNDQLYQCNEYGAGGYLNQSDYFAYLSLNPDNKMQIVLEGVPEKSESIVELPEELSNRFKSELLKESTDLWLEPVTDRQKIQYFYPRDDLLLSNKNLILSFSRLVVVLDLNNMTYKGSELLLGQSYSIVASSYKLENKSTLPVVLVNAYWEGSQIPNLILDLSGSELKTISLLATNYGNLAGSMSIGSSLTKTPVQWSENSIKLTYINSVDLYGSLPKSIRSKAIDNYSNDSFDYSLLNQEADDYLNNQNNYVGVECSLAPGMYSGCFGITKVTMVEYSPQKGLSSWSLI